MCGAHLKKCHRGNLTPQLGQVAWYFILEVGILLPICFFLQRLIRRVVQQEGTEETRNGEGGNPKGIVGRGRSCLFSGRRAGSKVALVAPSRCRLSGLRQGGPVL